MTDLTPARRVSVRLPDDLLAAVDEAVEEGRQPTRSAAIRAALREAYGDEQASTTGGDA